MGSPTWLLCLPLFESLPRLYLNPTPSHHNCLRPTALKIIEIISVIYEKVVSKGEGRKLETGYLVSYDTHNKLTKFNTPKL